MSGPHPADCEIRKRLSYNVARNLAKRGMTRRELAARIGLTIKYIGRVARGEVNVSLERFELIPYALETTEYDLLKSIPRRRKKCAVARLRGDR
jgi:transcriptional regulator with XRE-family HTH domain